MRSWKVPIIGVACALVAGGVLLATGQAVTATLLFAWLVAVALISSPLVFPRSVTAARAQAGSTGDGRPIVYWRPGCPYCLRLRFGLGQAARRAYWVNIWHDPDGAAAVRAVAEGNETVPTVFAAGTGHVNPTAATVRTLLPH